MRTRSWLPCGFLLLSGAAGAVACASSSDGRSAVDTVREALSSAALPAPLRVFGQPDMKQTNYNEVVANRANYPTGVLVDREPTAGVNSKVYVYDSGNNRILGFETIGSCAGGSKAGQACTEDSFCTGGTCNIDPAKSAKFALGQPTATGTSACNGDNTTRAAASASSLCLIPYPAQVSPLEGPRGGQMGRDSSRNLYVVDTFNNRVLKYNNPFATGADTVADWQFGQASMTARLCNQGLTAPTAQTLCTGTIDELPYWMFFTSSVDVSPDGQQVWIADPGNHRVLKVKPGTANAQLVLGQSSFTTNSGAGCETPTSSSICAPTGVAYDAASNKLYVLDAQDGGAGRVMVFSNPTTNGQAATIWNPPAATPFFWPRGLTLEPSTGALWVSDTENLRLERFVNGTVTHVIGDNDLVRDGDYCSGEPTSLCSPHGSMGIDRDGKFYIPDTVSERVKKFASAAPIGGAYVSATGSMFDQPGRNSAAYANRVGPSGLANPGYVAFVGTQLLVADRWRIVFWNNYASTTPFAAGNAAGVLAQADLFSQETNDLNRHSLGWGSNFTSLAYDATRKLLYATVGDRIVVWSVGTSGLTSTQAPVQNFTALDLKTPDGATLPCFNNSCSFTHLHVDAASDIGWLVDSTSNRVLRITSLSSATNRRVDLLLGQNNLTARICNRGNGNGGSPPNGFTTPNGFCDPSQVVLDAQGNLFVVDGTWECREGNCRIVQYQKSDLPAPNGTLRIPTANPVRVYGPSDFVSRNCDPSSGRLCAPRFLAFDPRDGAMVASGDAYYNPLTRRLAVFTNPTKAGVTSPVPSAFYTSLPINQAGNIAIDANGVMAVLDHTWNRVSLFQTPACNPATDDCASSGSGSTPCAGLCSNPVQFSSTGYNSGNLGTGATCHETTANIVSGNCGNMGSRAFTINGTTMTCNFQNFASLPAKRNGGYCFRATAGTPSYAYFSTF